jgi:hypothetical protein
MSNQELIQKELPIEEMLVILVAVTKEMKAKLPNIPLPNIVDRVVEPVAFMLFQAIMDEIDPEWVHDNIEVLNVAPDSTFVAGPETLQ